jgi:hypothetical protein
MTAAGPHSDTIALSGGEASGDQLPRVIPRALFDSLLPSLQAAEFVFNKLLEEGGKNSREVGVFAVNSTAMSCTVHQQQGRDGATVVIPLGFIGRLRVLSRLLLRFWNSSKHVAILNSPLDNIPEGKFKVPEKLRPLFGSYPAGAAATFWDELARRDDMIKLNPTAELDVGELLHLGLFHVMFHEFAHHWMRHFDLLGSRALDAAAGRHGLSRAEVEKGVELHADVVGSSMAVNVHVGHIAGVCGRDDLGSLSRAFLRLSYVTTLPYSLYEPRRKYLGAYDANRYTHPLVRRHAFVIATTSALAGQTPEIQQIWHDTELQGWTEALYAMNDLNLEAMKGIYGPVNFDEMFFPLHVNPGSTVTAPYIDTMVAEAFELIQRFADLLHELTGAESTPIPRYDLAASARKSLAEYVNKWKQFGNDDETVNWKAIIEDPIAFARRGATGNPQEDAVKEEFYRGFAAFARKAGMVNPTNRQGFALMTAFGKYWLEQPPGQGHSHDSADGS